MEGAAQWLREESSLDSCQKCFSEVKYKLNIVSHQVTLLITYEAPLPPHLPTHPSHVPPSLLPPISLFLIE